MKKNIIYTLGLSLALVACDSYLDLEPKGSSVLNTTGDYLGLIENTGGFPFDSEFYMCGEATFNNASMIPTYTYPLISCATLWDESFDRTPYMPEGSATSIYHACYEEIAKYNMVIDNMNDADGPESDKKLGIAQAKILRAYNYFVLINTYAKPYDPATAETERGIILREKFNLEDEGTQSTVADAYRLINQDIEDALSNLPHRALNNFRPDKAFGLALIAKVLLYQRQIDLALQAALDAIEEAEKNGGHKIWDMNPAYNEAVSMFAPMYGEENIVYDGEKYSSFRSMSQSMFWGKEYDNPENLFYAHGINATSPYPSLIRKEIAVLFDPESDLRYTFFLGTMPSRSQAEGGSVSVYNQALRWNCGGIKLTEVYLMAAECYARKGDKTNAMKYVNTVRKNRIMTAAYEDLTATDANDAMTKVRQERTRELMLTSNGFFDMRRFCTEFNETQTRQYEGSTYTLSPGSHLLIYPFPLSAVQNSNLTQNSK